MLLLWFRVDERDLATPRWLMMEKAIPAALRKRAKRGKGVFPPFSFILSFLLLTERFENKIFFFAVPVRRELSGVAAFPLLPSRRNDRRCLGSAVLAGRK